MQIVLKLSLGLLLVSCEDFHIEKDAEAFCSCRRLNLEDPSSCNKLLDSLNREYQFDPESTEYLYQKIEECLPK